MRIKRVDPPAALPGGVVRVQLEGLEDPTGLRVEIGEAEAECVGASPTALTVRVPYGAIKEGIRVYAAGQQARSRFRVGRVIAGELHSVANPVVDLSGNIYCTYSGTRGEKVPFSVYSIDPEGNKQPFLADITNATSLAIGPDQHLYISSRQTGAIYRSTFDKRVEKYVEGLGIATGIAFDSKGNLLVGDRGGFIHRVTPERETAVLCELEPSVSAYHLAIDSDDVLWVSGPTLSSQDSIYRVTPEGHPHVFFRGFGRPQGLVFDPAGKLQVVASYKGKKGIYTFKNGEPALMVAAPMLVGLAYSADKSVLYAVDSANLYRFDL